MVETSAALLAFESAETKAVPTVVSMVDSMVFSKAVQKVDSKAAC